MNSINYLFQKRKENDWTDFLNEKFTKVELVDAPDDAGEVGSTRAALKEFATTAVNMKYGSDKEVYSFFKNGRAVSKDISGESYVIFKGMVLIDIAKTINTISAQKDSGLLLGEQGLSLKL